MIALDEEGVVEVAILGRLLNPEGLGELGPAVCEAFDAAVSSFADADDSTRHDGVLQAADGTAEQYRALDRVVEKVLRTAPPLTPAPLPGDDVETVEEPGVTLSYAQGVLVAVDFDDEVVYRTPHDVGGSLRQALNRGLRLAAEAELAPPRPATQHELDELVTRIQRLERGLFE
jgi:hypothetical protein